MSWKLKQIAKAFKKNANVALCAEHCLNQNLKKITITELFHQQMTNVNPSSVSKINVNVHTNDDTPQNYHGGTELLINYISRGHNVGNRVGLSGLDRWM